MGAIAPEHVRLPSYELKHALALEAQIEASALAAREMAQRLINREDQLYTDDAARLANVAIKLDELRAALAALTSR